MKAVPARLLRASHRFRYLICGAAVAVVMLFLVVAAVLTEHPPLTSLPPGDCTVPVYASIATIPGREDRAESVAAWLLSHPLAHMITSVNYYVPRVLIRKNITTNQTAAARICERFPDKCRVHFVDDIGSISKYFFVQDAAPADHNILFLDDDRILSDVKLTYLLRHGCHLDVLATSGYINRFNFVKNILGWFRHRFLFHVDVVRGTGMVYVSKRIKLAVPPPGHPCFLMDDEVLSGLFKLSGSDLYVTSAYGDLEFQAYGLLPLAGEIDRSQYSDMCAHFGHDTITY